MIRNLCGNKFVRLVFGLIQSPFILEATFKVHFHDYLTNHPKITENISNYMYVDDLTSGGNTVGKVEIFNRNVKSYFKKVVSVYTSSNTYRH